MATRADDAVSAAPDSASGSCLCGAVTFLARFPTNWIAHCHCTICQRAHGAAFVTWASVPEGQLTITDPQSALHWYASSSKGRRGFCTKCGSSLFFRSPDWPGEVHVARSNFATALDRAPTVHGYYETHVDWFDVNDPLPKEPG